MGQRRKQIQQERQQAAEEFLSKKCTLDDLLDVKTKWEMIKMTPEQQEEFIRLKKIEVDCNNLLACVAVAKEKYNGLNVYENAEKQGLTENMTDEQKELLKNLTKTVDLKRILFITRRGSIVLLNLIAITNFLISIYAHDLYEKIYVPENRVFWGLFGFIILCFVFDIKMNKQIARYVYEIAKINHR